MITVEWANETKTAINCRLPKGWTWEDFYAAQKEVDALIDTVPGIVDTIFLPEESGHPPPSTLTHLRNVTLRRHKRYGLSILVDPNAYMQVLLGALGRIMPNDNIIRFVETEEEAHALVERMQQKRRLQQQV